MLSEEEEEEEVDVDSTQKKSPARRLSRIPQQILTTSNQQWTDEHVKQFNSVLSRRGTKESPVDDKTEKKCETPVEYETFESSSGEENTQLIFESEALSFDNKRKQPTSKEKEVKRIERQKRKYRKLDDKVKVLREDERAKKKRRVVFDRRLDNLPLRESQQDDLL